VVGGEQQAPPATSDVLRGSGHTTSGMAGGHHDVVSEDQQAASGEGIRGLMETEQPTGGLGLHCTASHARSPVVLNLGGEGAVEPVTGSDRARAAPQPPLPPPQLALPTGNGHGRAAATPAMPPPPLPPPALAPPPWMPCLSAQALRRSGFNTETGAPLQLPDASATAAPPNLHTAHHPAPGNLPALLALQSGAAHSAAGAPAGMTVPGLHALRSGPPAASATQHLLVGPVDNCALGAGMPGQRRTASLTVLASAPPPPPLAPPPPQALLAAGRAGAGGAEPPACPIIPAQPAHPDPQAGSAPHDAGDM
jgi:hypothetical protein